MGKRPNQQFVPNDVIRNSMIECDDPLMVSGDDHPSFLSMATYYSRDTMVKPFDDTLRDIDLSSTA
jgi:hypothetical protein